MKTLIIKAHPSTEGFTHTIANTYRDAVEAKGVEVVVVDLYSDAEYAQPFLSFSDPRGDWSGQEARELIQSKITWADELVFIYPLWWISMPAIMKNFIDNNFTKDFAFKYSQKGKPVGLLEGKTVRLFTTADGPSMMYAILKPIMLKPIFAKAIFGFCGMKLTSFDMFTNMVGQQSDDARAKMLEQVSARA